MLFYIALFSLLVMAAIAMPSINVIASVRGKKFEIEAETVEEFTSKVENAANLEAGQQSVLFRGKVLSPSDILAEVGVSANDVLMVVKGRRHRSKPDAESSDVALAGGLDADAYQKAIDGGANPEEMKKAMQAMDSLLDSDFVDEYFSDDAKLEAARLQLLENIDKYDQMMPGFKEQGLSGNVCIVTCHVVLIFSVDNQF